ncbi:MAG: asparagine synthase (glutamine-hydrolyzing) [Planctomycetes bacterium]|nr:asparagine synthase (glutamine-hydrolyzing) [Planctomycetota bacterium]
MCGICGRYNFDPADKVAASTIREMRDTMAHRGPDDAGERLSGAFGMGARRLSIIDLQGGGQPISNESGLVWAVLNGEIYNFRELRDDLMKKGHVFRTDVDTEVIPHAYEEYGDDCVRRFNGMFAIAIWDEGRRRLLVFRDRFGIKPVYYYTNTKCFLFASEIRAILHDPHVPRRLNRQAAWDYMHIGCVCAPDTILEGIRKLPPGQCIEVKDTSVRTRRWWSLSDEVNRVSDPRPPEEAVRELLDDAVRLRLVADVPLGIFLSGGVDSAAITAAAASAKRRPIRTFTIGFPVKPYDERRAAAATARFCGAEHEFLVVQPDAMHILGEVVEHLEEPMADPAAIPLYYLCKMAKGKVKSVLVGDGGDELFAGYARYYWDKWARAYRYVPRLLRECVIGPLASFLPETMHSDWRNFCRRARKFAVTSGLPLPERCCAWSRILSPDARNELLTRAFRGDGLSGTERIYLRLAGESRTSDPLRQMQYIDVHTMLGEKLLLKADKMSMAHSIEVRVPYLDHRLVVYALSLPAKLKVRGAQMKWILKRSLANRIPGRVLAEEKRGFRVPISVWFQGKLSDFASEILAEEEMKKIGLFDPKAVSRLLRLHREQVRDAEMAIYALMVFRLWHATYLEGARV